MHAIAELFQESFGYSLAQSLWQWKYAENRGRNLVVKKEQKIVAHYGGMQRQILYFGKPEKAIQIGDVMVAKNARGVLKKRGLYFQLTAEFLDRYIGYETEHLVGFGFPTPKALKLACKLDLYRVVDEVTELTFPAIDTRPSYRYGLIELTHENMSKHAHSIQSLWSVVKKDFYQDIIVERDLEYLKFRYFEHPVNEYKCFLMQHRLTRKIMGLMIFKYRQEISRWIMVDFVASEQHLPTIFFQAGRIMHHMGASDYIVWITKSHIERLPKEWVKQSAANIFIPSNNWNDGPSQEKLEGKWWLTAGDTDFL